MSSTSQPLQHQRVTYAWLVHIFTMTGVIWACLAIAALFQGEILQMWMWLGIALIVDGLDGNLARKADVKKYAPNFDGTVLDIMVDYLTWTFIPALFMYIHLPLGGSWTSAAMFALICTSSVFTYCNVKLKTHDYYFMGFPAAWNIVAVVMWIVGSGSALNVTVTIVLAFLTVAPLTFVHPFRVARLMPMNIATAFGWIVTTAILLVQHPDRALVVEVIWWACGAWLMGLSAYRTVQEIRARSKAVVGNQ